MSLADEYMAIGGLVVTARRPKQKVDLRAQREYPETKTWHQYEKLYASKRSKIIEEGDKLLFNLIQRFNADMMDLHSGNEVDLNELKMDAQDLKMHARENYPEFLPLVTELVSEYILYWKNNQ
jgi:hypothetical protein